MSAYIEVMVEGGCRAYLSASSFVGVLTMGGSPDEPASPERPLAIIMSSGETIQGVYGVSPNRIIFWVEGAKALAKATHRPMVVAYLDKIAEFESQVLQLFTGAVEDG